MNFCIELNFRIFRLNSTNSEQNYWSWYWVLVSSAYEQCHVCEGCVTLGLVGWSTLLQPAYRLVQGCLCSQTIVHINLDV